MNMNKSIQSSAQYATVSFTQLSQKGKENGVHVSLTPEQDVKANYFLELTEAVKLLGCMQGSIDAALNSDDVSEEMKHYIRKEMEWIRNDSAIRSG